MRRLLPLILVLTACGSDAAVETMVPVAEPTANSTTVVESTTTTGAVGPVDICPRGVVWEPGLTYEAVCFVVPVSFTVTEDGFGSEGAGDDWLTIRWRDPDDRNFLVRLGVISYRSDESPEMVAEAITARKGIAALSEPQPTTVAGKEALVMDVEGLAREGLSDQDQDYECYADGVIRFVSGGGGNPIIGGVGRADAIGVSYCDVATVWTVQVDGQAVTLIGGTADPARHPEAVAKIEELFEGMSFDTGGGS